MKIDYLEVGKIALPIIAIVISMLTIYFTRKNIKKQIRVSKIEEILEILNSLSKYYMPLFWFANDIGTTDKKIKAGEKLVGDELEHDKKVKDFLSKINKELLQEKASRLYVLVNAYLPNKANSNLKARVLALNHLYSVLFHTVQNNDLYLINEHFKEGIPRRKKISLFIIAIENDLIKEMELGYKSLSNEEFSAYRDKQFKIDVGILK